MSRPTHLIVVIRGKRDNRKEEEQEEEESRENKYAKEYVPVGRRARLSFRPLRRCRRPRRLDPDAT